jgi:hypothetical protein
VSANIYWEPVRRNRESLYTLAPQAFLESLEAANMSPDYPLNEENLNALRGMAKIHGELNDKNPYHQLVEAIMIHDVIELTVEY